MSKMIPNGVFLNTLSDFITFPTIHSKIKETYFWRKKIFVLDFFKECFDRA